MKKSLLFLVSILMSINLYAYSDSDLDGVEDSVDKCPNTPLTDLADISGCTKTSVVSPHHFDMVVGLNYRDEELGGADTISTSLQVDYYFKQFSIQASTSYYTTDASVGYSESGLEDSFIGASYRLNKINDLSISLSAGVILPTYETELDNNNMDYTASVNLSYALANLNIFGGYSLTLINDDDTIVTTSDGDKALVYQNTNAFNAGVGYYLSNKLYMSASYSLSDSIYSEYEDVESATVYGYYSIDKSRFATFSYAYGLSDSASDNYVSVRLGFLF